MSDHARFAAALLDPDCACPPEFCSWNDSDPAKRFAVHRNNFVVSLIDALAAQFPVTQELVGVEFFRAMARAFVQHDPPRSRVIAFIGAPFADFIAAFSPAASVPYLADMARLEMVRIVSCHAQDLETMMPQAFGRAMTDPEQLARQIVTLHPSVHLLSSRHAIFSLWAAHQGELDIADVDPDIAQHVLVFRDGLDVQTLQISAGACCFFQQLQSAQPLADAAGAASDADTQFDLAATIALLLRHPLANRMETSR